MIKQGGLLGATSWALFALSCGSAGAPDASGAGPSADGESEGEIHSLLDTTCSVAVFAVQQDFEPTLGGHLGFSADARCTDHAPLEYRLTAINPKNQTLVLQDWSYGSGPPGLTLPVGAPEGTYTLVAEARRAGSTVVAAKGTQKVVIGRSCVGATLSTSPTGGAAIGTAVQVAAQLYCQDIAHEWRLTVTKPGGGSVSYPWQTASDIIWDTTGLNAGKATVQLSARNVGNTVVDATAKTTFMVGPVCSAATLTASGTGSTRALAATATCVNDGVAVYRYSVAAPDGLQSELRGFDNKPSFDWDVSGLNGAFTVKVEVRAEQAPGAALSAKTLKTNLGNACTKLTLPDLWGQHLQSEPLLATATANCDNAEFQFQRRTPLTTAWTTVCAYSASPSCDLNQQPAPLGDYVVRALVRKQGSIAAYDVASSQREYIATDGRPLLRTFAPQATYNLAALSSDGRWVLGTNFRWSRTNGYAVLDRPDTAVSNYQPGGATDLNDAGSIIVGWDTGTRDEPFRWQSNVAQWLLPTQAFYQAHANATSANGSVIVGFIHNIPEQQAFRWTSAGVELLGDLPGGYVSSDARDVSGDGNVIVGTGWATDHYEGFRWTAATGIVSLGLLPGDVGTNVTRVSRNGAVIIGQSTDGSRGHAVRWTADGGLQRLSEPLGSTLSGATAVTADGSTILGFAGPLGSPTAAIWTDAEGGRYLADVLTGRGVDVSGWDLATVVDVSSDGKTILGTGSAPGVGLTGWLISLP